MKLKLKNIIAVVMALCLCLLATALSGCSKEDKLSAKKEKEIKEAYVKLLRKSYLDKEFTVDNVDPRYIGTYNGAIVVLLYPNLGEGSDECEVGHIYIEGYDIHTPYKNMLIHVYKNGKFIEIEEAYEKGMLTEEDIADIAGGRRKP